MPNKQDMPNIFSPKSFRLAKPVLKFVLVLTTASLMIIPQISSATNGMNMEGYGPIRSEEHTSELQSH